MPYDGGMMGGNCYGGMTGGYYRMMRGFGGGWFYGLAAIGVVLGIVVLVGAVMTYNQLTEASTRGAIVSAFSIASPFGMEGSSWDRCWVS